MATITFIGAGSVVFNKNLLGDILSYPELQSSTIRLHDIDPVRLETSEMMARQIAEKLEASPIIEAHSDRKRSLEGTDYVINMIGVGGHSAARIDFDVPRRYGLQQTIADTHSIGGMFRALRTIPVLLNIAKDIEQVCPDALLLNYTNPMSMLIRTLFEVSRIKAVGLCHSVQGTVAAMARYCGKPAGEITFLGAGINHLAWILKFEHQGQDAYPALRLAVEQNMIPQTDLVRAELFRRTGYYVTESSEHLAEYLPYFIPHNGQIEKFNIPIGEYLKRSEKGLIEFSDLRNRLLSGIPIEVKRSTEYASRIIYSMETGIPILIYGNVRNDHLIDNLPVGSCVEVPCHVDRSGIQPLHVGSLPPHLAALIQPHIFVQELTVQAALEGKREHLYHAAMVDPLVSSSLTLEKIWQLVDDMIAAHGAALPESIRGKAPVSSYITQEPGLIKN